MAAWAWEVSSQQVRRKNDELCRLSRITDYTRAVQRFLHEPQWTQSVEATEGYAIAGVADVFNAIEAQDIGRKRSQACENAWIVANAAVFSRKLPSRT
jgi:hypothetical protein